MSNLSTLKNIAANTPYSKPKPPKEAPPPIDYTEAFKIFTQAIVEALNQQSVVIQNSTPEPGDVEVNIDLSKLEDGLRSLETCIDRNTAAIGKLEKAYRSPKTLTEKDGTLRLSIG